MILSMTGYGKSVVVYNGKKINVEIKSLNSKALDLPNGLDTRCSEQGGGLSEGQAQRIAIARALLRNRAVLVFDEATSALDSETECRLLRNILEGEKHTVIFITHRPAVLAYCDQQLVIN